MKIVEEGVQPVGFVRLSAWVTFRTGGQRTQDCRQQDCRAQNHGETGREATPSRCLLRPGPLELEHWTHALLDWTHAPSLSAA